jgi:flap endonuclease-1
MVQDFKNNGIKPIFVFDGKPLEQKELMLNKRKQEKIDAELLFNSNSSETTTIAQEKLSKKFIRPTKKTTDIVKNILINKNIRYINAPNEADPICAWLVNTDQAWACLSDDTDMFIYGCRRVLRSYSLKTKSFMFYPFDKMLNHLKLTIDDFRFICVISGTDYNPNEENIDIFDSFKLFEQYKTDINKDQSINFIDWLLEKNIIDGNTNYYDILDIMDLRNVSPLSTEKKTTIE